MVNINETNGLNIGDIFITEGESIKYCCMVMKGKVEIYKKGFSVVVSAGSMLGAEFISGEKNYLYSCRVKEAASIYAFSPDEATYTKLLRMKNDYNGIIIFNQLRLLKDLKEKNQQLSSYAAETEAFAKECYETFLKELKNSKCPGVPISELAKLLVEQEADNDNKDASDDAKVDQPANNEDIAAYIELLKVPYDVMKAFYGPAIGMSLKTFKELQGFELDLLADCGDTADTIINLYKYLAGNSEYSLFRSLSELILEMGKKGLNTSNVVKLTERILQRAEQIEERFYTVRMKEELDKLKVICDRAIKGDDFRADKDNKDSAVSIEVMQELPKLQDSLAQITQFAALDKEKSEEFSSLIDEFNALPDKEKVDDTIRVLRKKISEVFYQLYGRVFAKAYHNPSIPKAVELFLNFGYVSEKLLSEDQLISLLTLRFDEIQTPCCIHTMRNWLEKIYEGKKDPSRNDMGEDYNDVLRNLKKSGRIDEKKEKELQKDGMARLDFEIKNMFASASRTVNGRLSIFVPILYSDAIIGDLKKAFVNCGNINAKISELVKLDYSAFRRETLYVNKENNVEHEYIMKNVMPDIIIFPTIGQNVIMWQEIAGRKRDSAARYLAPVFTFGNLYDMLVKATGQFRWQMCKTLLGANWNNIQYNSLTGEYSDYIQFYKKNKELSEEKKEKIKNQIQRGRNNLRDIFTSDYEVWIKSESNGAIKMNKVAREILATYCPFAAEVKNSLIKQPIYEEAFSKSNRERAKKVHELELRFRNLEKSGGMITEELFETMRFYSEM